MSIRREVLEVRTRMGKSLQAFAGDSITREIIEKGEYDGNTLTSLRDVLSVIRPKTSLDIGANIGNHAVVIAQFSDTLVAFEPLPFVFELLRHNLERNGCHHVYAVNVALSDVNSSRDILVPENDNLGSSSLELMSEDGTYLRIETRRGDDYLAENFAGTQIDFIKIDVEGHEPATLNGLAKTISSHQPLILMEYRHQNTLTLFWDQSLMKQLFPGYSIYSLTDTASKKAHPPGMVGMLRRWLAKLKGRHWCLSDFDASRRYSNIYLVPERYQALFAQFPKLSSK
jgi:FkbM family methyltransferase